MNSVEASMGSLPIGTTGSSAREMEEEKRTTAGDKSFKDTYSSGQSTLRGMMNATANANRVDVGLAVSVCIWIIIIWAVLHTILAEFITRFPIANTTDLRLQIGKAPISRLIMWIIRNKLDTPRLPTV
jgi:hypothetical protein